MIIVGIDPGVTGALAIFNAGTLHQVVDMPVEASRANGAEIAYILLSHGKPDVVYLEWTQPMPKNGSIASYSLGLNSGIVIGVVQALGISLERVRPQAWKSAMGLSRKPKAASRGMATELFPHFADQFRRVKDDGRAEAALIARYGTYQNIRQAMTGVEDNEEVASVSDLQGRDRHPSGANGRTSA
jgi:crossover junction endodeoxyribonuclease RuvC